MKFFLSALCLLISLQCFSEASKILALIPFNAKSHFAPFEPFLKSLAEKGHELTVVSHFPRKQKIPNYTDIDISSSLPTMVGTFDAGVVQNFTIWVNAKFMWRYGGWGICRPVLNHPGVKRLLESNEKFDLIISEIFATDCFLGFVKRFDVPYVGFSSSVALPWLPSVLGNPDNPSYIPHFFSYYADRMNYVERFLNTIYLLALKIGYRFYSDEPSYEIAKDFFGPDLPPLEELRSRIALVLLNGHPAVTPPRALAPGVKEVGGIHIPSSGPVDLPRELKEYLDSATEGVVYFSMGSQVNTATFPDRNLAILRRAFAELPQRVLWKCDEREMLQLPKNVKCLDWAPQLSILCHPNVRVFFSHGGLLGFQEAVYCGVPILGMPLFGDQFSNVRYGLDQGYALKVDFLNLSFEEISGNLKKLLTDESYTKRAREALSKFRHRSQAPLKEAVFWVEYVLRHGPDTLKTATSELTWYQYLLLDVIAGIIFIIFLCLWILNRLINEIFGQRKRVVSGKRKKN